MAILVLSERPLPSRDRAAAFALWYKETILAARCSSYNHQALSSASPPTSSPSLPPLPGNRSAATPKGKSTLIKSEFYDMYGSGYDSLCIGSERDPQNHARMKKSLSAAFSTKALMEQEEIIQRCVDGFVDKVGHESKRERESM